MNFTHPEILYGLLAMLIPVIVHLFNFRRYKKFYFSNVALLKDISFETKKKNRVKHIIVMILRMLAIAMLVIAFAGPNFNKKNINSKSSQSITGIYIDNSFSMEAGDRQGRLFDHSIAVARELIKHSSRDARFLVLDNNPRALGLRPLNKDEALSHVDNITISANHKETVSIIDDFVMFKLKNEDYGVNAYFFSDFQISSFNTSSFPIDSLINWNFVHIQHQSTPNILIDSCWIEDPVVLPGRIISLFVRLKNVSTQSYEKTGVKLYINDQNKSIASVDLPGNSQKTIKMQFNAGEKGWKSAYLEIEDYPVTFDDILYFSFYVDEKINVLSINPSENDKYLKAFFSSDSVFEFSQNNYKSIDYKRLIDNQLIILNGISEISSGLGNQIKVFVENGGNLMIFPPDNDNITGLNKLLKQFNAGSLSGPIETETRVKGIKLTNSIFSEAIDKIPDNTDLPRIYKKFDIKTNYTHKQEILISLLNDDAFLLKKEFGNGIIYLMTIPLSPEFSNLLSHPLFIPLMYGAAIDGKGFQKLFYTIGDNKEFTLNISDQNVDNQDLVFSIKRVDQEQSFIPLQQFRGNELIFSLSENIITAGIYQLKRNEISQALLAFNYNRKESLMEFHTASSLEEDLKKSGLVNYEVINLQSGTQDEIINSLQNESRLWLVFIILALSFLLMETIVLRFWP